MRYVSASLPKKLLASLKRCEGVNFRKDSEMPIFELVESETGTETFLNFLKDDNDEVDPMLTPTFGNPLYSYVPPAVQIEVFNLLVTYQSLVEANFRPGAAPFPFVGAQFPAAAPGIQFHHAKIAIHAVYEEIQGTNLFAAQCPGIAALLPGQVICDLGLVYANAFVLLRLRKV